MPRHPDPVLEERILNAARKLWIRGGDKALSMRTLAKAARTNTPAVYRRFRDRTEILRALVQRIQQDLLAQLESCGSPEEACERVLAFTLAHPREYQLINSGVFSHAGDARPNFELMKKKCAEWLGGSPEDHAGLVLTLWALMHGTASLIIAKAIPPGHETELRATVAEAAELLVKNASRLPVAQ